MRTTHYQIEAFTDDPAAELSEMATRLARFGELSISMQGQEILDDLATEMATKSGFVYGMVNAFSNEQTFLGLHNPAQESGYPIVGRTMRRDHGLCPEVVQRRLSLPLPDVAASPVSRATTSSTRSVSSPTSAARSSTRRPGSPCSPSASSTRNRAPSPTPPGFRASSRTPPV
ncbi:hypothetical protein ACRAWF_26625 [Streptomyces sp. L7]